MENADTKVKQSGVKNLIFLILLALAIGTLAYACVILVKNAEVIKSDPVAYAIDKEIYDSCSCFKEGIGFRKFGDNVVEEYSENLSGVWFNVP